MNYPEGVIHSLDVIYTLDVTRVLDMYDPLDVIRALDRPARRGRRLSRRIFDSGGMQNDVSAGGT